MLNQRNPKKHFDEMQVQVRNKAGNQSFFILYFLLMIDLLLPDFGLNWVVSPISILVIMFFSMGYYLIRIVWVGAGAYESQGTDRKHVYLSAALLVAVTTIMAIIKKTNFFKESLNISDGGFLRLFLFFVVFFTIIVVSRKISMRKNNKGDD